MVCILAYPIVFVPVEGHEASEGPSYINQAEATAVAHIISGLLAKEDVTVRGSFLLKQPLIRGWSEGDIPLKCRFSPSIFERTTVQRRFQELSR